MTIDDFKLQRCSDWPKLETVTDAYQALLRGKVLYYDLHDQDFDRDRYISHPFRLSFGVALNAANRLVWDCGFDDFDDDANSEILQCEIDHGRWSVWERVPR